MNTPNPLPVPTPLPSQFDSGIIKALLAALGALVAAFLTVFTHADTVKFLSHWELISSALITFIVVALPIGYAWWARLYHTTAPITQQAIDATLKRENTLIQKGASSPGVIQTK